MSYLDKTGLQYLWGKIRGIIGRGSLNTTNKTIIPAINELNNGKANTSTLAAVESSSTASKTYSVGNYLVYNGILYRVIAAISAGQTLTPGTNISATNAGAELTSLNNGLTEINSRMQANSFHLSGKTSYIITGSGSYSPMFFFGIIQSQRFAAIINPGYGAPQIDYVYRPNTSFTISLTGAGYNKFVLDAINTANDFYVIGAKTAN